MKQIFTESEIKAHMLLNRGNIMVTTENGDAITKSADEIILLAEKIKTERINQVRQIGLGNL